MTKDVFESIYKLASSETKFKMDEDMRKINKGYKDDPFSDLLGENNIFSTLMKSFK